MAAYDALLTAIQIKAFDDWRSTFTVLSHLKDRITKNPKGGLARRLINADQSWCSMTFNDRHAVLEMVSHEICHLYVIPPVGIYNWKSWLMLQKAQAPKMEMTLFDQNANGFYVYFKQAQVEYPSIVFPQEDYFQTHGFREVMETLAHELAHAVIDAQERKINQRMLERLKIWNDVERCIDQPYLDPLDTVGFLSFYEKIDKTMRKNKECRYAEARKAYDGQKYSDESALHGLWMIWEERCAYAFQHAVANTIWDALAEIGYTLGTAAKKE